VTFQATVVRVLIASPGDTGEGRLVIREALEEWNSLHAEETGVMLLPVMWERDATPEMGDRAQGIVNRQLVDAADVLLGTFWTRLGTPTSEAESGTVEEVNVFLKAGKPVHLWFSDEPVVPGSIDLDEYERLKRFRTETMAKGLIDSYSSPHELRRKVNRAITRTVRERFQRESANSEDSTANETTLLRGVPRASLLATIERERELSGLSSRGAPRYSTRYRLLIRNRGSSVAENLKLSTEMPEGGGAPPTIHTASGPVGRLPPGGSVEYPLGLYLGTAAQWDLVFTWNEGDETFTDRQTMR
jgi:nucleoside 2-deoxyribosyltransferase